MGKQKLRAIEIIEAKKLIKETNARKRLVDYHQRRKGF
jgi:hypothetical protein